MCPTTPYPPAVDSDSDKSYDDADECTEDSWDDENNTTIRAKWCMDSAKTLDECIEKLQAFIKYIEELKADGWELMEPVNDDWGHLKRCGGSSPSGGSPKDEANPPTNEGVQA